MSSFVRILVAAFVCSAFATVGAAIAGAIFFSGAPEGFDGLLGATFVLPFQLIVGALAGALVGIWPAVRVHRSMRAAELEAIADEPFPPEA